MSATLGSYQEALGQNVLPGSFGWLAAFSSRLTRRRPLFSGWLLTWGCCQLLEVDRVPWRVVTHHLKANSDHQVLSKLHISLITPSASWLLPFFCPPLILFDFSDCTGPIGRSRIISLLLLLLSRFSHIRLCDPVDGSPPGCPVPGILKARILEWVAISFSNA